MIQNSYEFFPNMKKVKENTLADKISKVKIEILYTVKENYLDISLR